MKLDIFNKYVDEVCNLFNIDEETLFIKSKRRDIVDARHLLYYLCYTRPMRIVYIQEYMADRGYTINHSSVIHGISIVGKKLDNDTDYVKSVKDIQKWHLV
jgi:chromosomal replication initiation ATPase DnaA|tara:strand:+ start:2658 stop:2960 length:303 start_codon:yes stop_codon:yes gene_type:complete